MATFGLESKRELATVHPSLIQIADMAITIMDFKVIQGGRSLEESIINVARGVSRLKDPSKSKHIVQPDGYAHAFDLAPYGLKGVDWQDTEMFCVLAGVILACAHILGVKIRWGGDWDSDGSTRDEKFRDYGHFELIFPLTEVV